MSAETPILFKALSDPMRRALFDRLARQELTVRALTEGSGISQPAISKHLAILKRAGLVTDRPEGRETYYRADLNGLVPLVDWVSQYTNFWDDRLSSLDSMLFRRDN